MFSSDSDDGDMQRALKASQKAYAKEQRQEQSSDDEEELDVLPPLCNTSPRKGNQKGPRLSFTGSEKDDPLVLLDDDDDDDDDDEDDSQLSRKAAAETKKKAPVDYGPVVAPASMDVPSSSDDEDLRTKPTQCENYQKKQKSAAVYQYNGNDSSDSSDDNSLDGIKQLLLTRKKTAPVVHQSKRPANTSKKSTTKAATSSRQATAKQKQKAEDKQQKKEAARLQALEKKEAAKQDKLRQRQAKKEALQVEAAAKKRRHQECAQASGKLAKDEIAVLLDGSLFYNSGTNGASSTLLVEELQEAGYVVQEHPSAAALQCSAVQWIRNDSLQGGAARAIEAMKTGQSDGYQHLPVLAVVLGDFIPLLARTEACALVEDDYPKLATWLKGIEAGWQAAWKTSKRPRIIVLLDCVKEQLDKQWVQHNKKKGAASRGSRSPPTGQELHDATFWLLIQFQVECIHCSSDEEISKHLSKMTRMLAEEPYQKQVTELECIKKLKAECDVATASAAEKAKDCWLRQLQQVPRVSRKMAFSLTCYYPTAASLWQAYQDPNLTVSEKRMLCAHMFSEKSTQAKLSSQLYTVMTSTDPNEILR